jgi:CrcB protein
MRDVALALAVALLGGSGAVLRFALDSAVQGRFAAEFPAGTLAVNLSGSFGLGLLVGAGGGGDLLLLGGGGALGSFTTFSTWAFESQRLAEDGALVPAGLNLALSLAAGLGVAALGRALGGLA